MFTCPTIPSSQAEKTEGESTQQNRIHFTAREMQNEQQVYASLDEQVRHLENKQEIDVHKLEDIEQAAAQIILSIEEKADLYQRVQWLKTIVETKEQLNTLQTKEEVQALALSLAGIQTSPVKQKLVEELNDLAQVLPEKVRATEEALMEKALEQAGDDFINLGKAGRDFVIERVMGEGDSSIEAIQSETKRVNDSVTFLRKTADRALFRSTMAELPVPSDQSLSAAHQDLLIQKVMDDTDWHDLLALRHTVTRMTQELADEMRTHDEAFTMQPASTVDAKIILKE